MNNKGFTLVELLAVITVLALIVGVAIPSTIGISNKIKQNMYCSKINNIASSAALYGEDNRGSLTLPLKNSEYKILFESMWNGEVNDIYYQKVSIKTLIEKGYIKKEVKEKEFEKIGGYILDPRTNEPMDEQEVLVYLKYNRVYSHFINEEANECINK